MPTTTARIPLSGQLPTPASSDVDLYRQMMGAENTVYSPLTPATGSSIDGTPARRPSEDTREYEREEREIFAKLEKPRVRYDVEVVTKLIVYAGKELYLISRYEDRSLRWCRHCLDCRRRQSDPVRADWARTGNTRRLKFFHMII